MILAALNRLRPSKNNTSGNAMIYVLVAIALFGILTATLSSQNNQSDGQDIDDEMVALYANELLEYSAAAKQVVDQMIMTGSTIDDLDFINPASAGFDTAPHIHKVFHPQGGGLNYRSKVNSNIAGTGGSLWSAINNSNVEWTDTGASDAIISALRIKEQVCKNINEKITGSNNIPQLINTTDGYFTNVFQAGTVNLTTTNCPIGCEGYTSLCIRNGDGSQLGFYTIIAGR